MTLPIESSTSVHIAIRLPNGRLAHDIPDEMRCGRPEYRAMPDGHSAYLWSEANEHQARVTIRNIAHTMKYVGADDLFKERARVVEVRITAEVTDRLEFAVSGSDE